VPNISNCLPFDGKFIRFYKTETLFTFDVQYPVNSTFIKLVATVRQLPYINYNQSLTISTMALTYPKQYKNNINLNMWNRAIIDFINAK
jgi:hypothetical protein